MFRELLDYSNPLYEVPKEALGTPFAEVIWPWMGFARKRLKEKAGERLYLLSAEALLSMELSLLKRWSELCTPSMLLCMEIEKAGFTLQGNTSRERYLNFIEKTYLREEGLIAFFEEYKELSRLVRTFLEFWENQAEEFLSRLEADLDFLAEVFNEGRSLGKVEALKLNAGDHHHEGRSVFILAFTSGKELVYKPKNLNIVKNFNAYIARLTDLGLKLPLKTYKVLPRGEYGWEEKVEHEPCRNLEEGYAYFKRAGMYLCLLYLLDGADVHYENIIASGAHPILIDLETLFHASLKNKNQEVTEEIAYHSVLSIGLLPQFRFGKMKQKGRDVSGLGFEEIDISETEWENMHTDEMASITKKSSHVYPNQVIFNKAVMLAKDHVHYIVSGFNEMYRFMQEKQPFLEVEEWPSLFAKDPVRILLRPTRFYAYILQNLYKPTVLLHENLREETLLLLSRPYSNGSERPEPIIAEERKALLQGDIPCFHAFPFSTDLFSKQKLIASNCLEKPAIERVHARFKNMNEADRSLQETFVRSAFYIKDASVHENTPLYLSKKGAGTLPSDKEILACVERLAVDLRKRAYQSEGGALGWINLEPNLDTEQYQLTPISEALYSGRGGIALFFAALSHITRNKRWKNEALNTLKGLRRLIAEGKSKQLVTGIGIGGMVGVGGAIYALFQSGRLLNLPYLIEDAKNLVYCLEETHIQEDTRHDLIFGKAGLILVLVAFFQHHPDPHFLKLAEQCGDYLCKKAQDLLENISEKLLLGLSHGTAGIAYALCKLGSITKNPLYDRTAQSFLAYERSHFSEEHGNWPHFGQNTYMCCWCHGATGIGFARHASLPFSKDPLIHQEIDIALKATETHLNDGSLNLCCGLLGRLEFLIAASYKKHNQTIQYSIGTIFDQLKQEDTEDFYNPGFMQGKAGLGYTLLRLIDRERSLPQVLLLQ